jgi:hypothetical protein
MATVIVREASSLFPVEEGWSAAVREVRAEIFQPGREPPNPPAAT